MDTNMPQGDREWVRLSPYRKNIIELMRLSRNVSLVTADRPMNLAPLVAARQLCMVRPGWAAIFAKAFAMVSVRRPELRRAFMSYPWPHLHQCSRNIATIVVEREIDGEHVPLFYHIRRPEEATILRVHEQIQVARTMPIEEFPKFRRMRFIGNAPGPLRFLLWRMAYHLSGKTRARYFGTFCLTSAGSGCGVHAVIAPLTCTLHPGLFDENGRIEMRLTFDHRVIDGAPVGRALAELEQTLVTEILSELRHIAQSQHAA